MGAVELLEQDDPGQLVGQGQLAQREAVIDAMEVKAVGTPDHEAQVLAALPALLQEAAQRDRVKLLASAVEQGDEGPLGQPAPDLLILANLDQFDPRVAGQELLIVLDVVGERWPQPTHGDDEDSHG